jgi:hypothetical protein
MNAVSRILRWLDGQVTARLDRELAVALPDRPSVTTSVAPLLSGYSINTRRYPCCAHCRAHWYPADCPVVHVSPCVDCEDGDVA